jgi:hypothetical protein
MKKLIFILIIIGTNFVISCEKSTDEENTPEEEIKEEKYYLSFKVTCWENEQYKPVYCNVEIFKNNQSSSVEKGATRTDGWYYTWFRPHFAFKDKARIILTDFSNNELMEVWDLTPEEDPIWFVKDKEDFGTNTLSDNSGHMHLGFCK